MFFSSTARLYSSPCVNQQGSTVGSGSDTIETDLAFNLSSHIQ